MWTVPLGRCVRYRPRKLDQVAGAGCVVILAYALLLVVEFKLLSVGLKRRQFDADRVPW